MKSLDQLWDLLESAAECGGSRRVDEEFGHDFYASLGQDGRRGIQLITSVEPPTAPAFEAVDIAVGRRGDSRWLVSIWLKDASLANVFAQLCQNLIESSRSVGAEQLPAFVFGRLIKWHRLLEVGSGEALGINALRGLVGELIVFQHLLGSLPAQTVVEGWIGPFHGPQDFALPSGLIEVKAVMQSAATVQINSIEQLDVPDEINLTLAIVTLSAPTPGESIGFSPLWLSNDIRKKLESTPQALMDFDDRLLAAGFVDSPQYDRVRFRLEGLKFYNIAGSFPRLTRAMLPEGITKGVYQVSIGACAGYELGELPDGA